MLIEKDKLQHLNSITHEGKVVVMATDAEGKMPKPIISSPF